MDIFNPFIESSFGIVFFIWTIKVYKILSQIIKIIQQIIFQLWHKYIYILYFGGKIYKHLFWIWSCLKTEVVWRYPTFWCFIYWQAKFWLCLKLCKMKSNIVTEFCELELHYLLFSDPLRAWACITWFLKSGTINCTVLHRRKFESTNRLFILIIIRFPSVITRTFMMTTRLQPIYIEFYSI